MATQPYVAKRTFLDTTPNEVDWDAVTVFTGYRLDLDPAEPTTQEWLDSGLIVDPSTGEYFSEFSVSSNTTDFEYTWTIVGQAYGYTEVQVDYGDGTFETITGSTGNHTYAGDGTYEVTFVLNSGPTTKETVVISQGGGP